MSSQAPPLVATRQPVELSILRMLYWELVRLQDNTPYRDARLRRIADQLDYVIYSWPVTQWPAYSTDGIEVPVPAILQSWIAAPPTDTLQREQLLRIVRLLM